VEGNLLCLGIQKSDNVNIIGQNFMAGYRIVFDRENMNLGWKESNCTEEVLSNTLPINPSHSPVVSPAMAVNPVATSNPSSNPGRLSPNRSFRMKPALAFMV
ncbi:Peptidase family A1 domain, partial [Sesbania bispinosa]